VLALKFPMSEFRQIMGTKNLPREARSKHASSNYTLRTINLNAFANGAAHQILFEYIGPSSGTGSYVIDDVSLEICALASSDLSVTKVDSPDPVAAGNNLTYTITVANSGPDPALTVELRDTVPANTTFVSFTAPGGWSTTTPAVGGTGDVVATNPSLASGSPPAVFTLVVNVNAGTTVGTTLSNTATVTTASFDSNASNNSDTETTMVNTPCTDVIVDGGFENGGIPSTFWDPETSTNFGTPLCDNASCGTGGGASPPRTGLIWAWFGGIPAPETATLGQTVTLAAGATVNLNFWMRIGTVSAPFTDVLNVRVDSIIQQVFPEPTVAEGAYTLRTTNLNAFADGASHQILFEYIGPSSGTGSYVIDDVSLLVCSGPVIVANGSILVNESCPPANGQIDPGERATVHLKLKNNGGAATSNLVATLQSSGGVVAPSAPQNYGVISPGATVGRDFSFTADPAVGPGGTITATLQLQDGATNLGTVTYTFTAGPSPCGGVRLVTSSTLARMGSNVLATVTVSNIGTLPAVNVMLTTATLGGTSGTPLPQSLGTIGPGSSVNTTVNFATSSTGPSTLTLGGTYTGGTFTSTKRVVIP
jgi:uncharacterized repeat protein (TIGR01451 family)